MSLMEIKLYYDQLVSCFYAELWWSVFLLSIGNWVIVLGKIKLVVSSAVLNYT